jgi:uncharacterized membrane protein
LNTSALHKPKLVALVLVSVLVMSTAQTLMKSGMNDVSVSGALVVTDPSTWMAVLTDLRIVAGLVMVGCAFLIWLGALSKAEVSFLHPLAATAYVLTTLFAIVFLGEAVSVARWAGVGLIAVGSAMVARS